MSYEEFPVKRCVMIWLGVNIASCLSFYLWCLHFPVKMEIGGLGILQRYDKAMLFTAALLMGFSIVCRALRKDIADAVVCSYVAGIFPALIFLNMGRGQFVVSIILIFGFCGALRLFFSSRYHQHEYWLYEGEKALIILALAQIIFLGEMHAIVKYLIG